GDDYKVHYDRVFDGKNHDSIVTIRCRDGTILGPHHNNIDQWVSISKSLQPYDVAIYSTEFDRLYSHVLGEGQFDPYPTPTPPPSLSSIDISDTQSVSPGQYSSASTHLTTTGAPLDYIYIQNIENIESIETMYHTPFTNAKVGVVLWYVDVQPSGSYPITFRYGSLSGPVVGTGTLSYSGYLAADPPPDPTQSYVRLDVSTWDRSVYRGDTGAKKIYLDKPPRYNLHYVGTSVNQANPDAPIIFGGVAGHFNVQYQTMFKHRLWLEDAGDDYKVHYDRVFDGKNHDSIVTIRCRDGTILGPYHNNIDQWVSISKSLQPYDVTIYSTEFDRTYAYTIDDGKIRQSNPDPTTIYVRCADTGLPIPFARVTVLDSLTNGPVVDEIIKTGTKTYDLEKSHSLRYLASATADGYTLLSPIQFDVVSGGASITLWMHPTAPPSSDPPDPGKTMLYGYILTRGSQQPISGATVTLNGSNSVVTTSAGSYLFNNIDPGTHTLSVIAPDHNPLSESVTVDAAPTLHNLALTGNHTLKITAKDAETLQTLTNATIISLDDGQQADNKNPASFPVDYGTYMITVTAEGYYYTQQYQYIDKLGETQATILLSPKTAPPTPPELPNYPPHNVKFTVQTLFGSPLSGVNVSAQGIQQTPSTNIIERLLGITMTSTPITTELMSGTTDSNGEINFMMVEVVKYQITLYKPDVVNQTLEIYPKEDTYPIRISTLGGPLLPDAGDPLRDIHINVTTSTEGDAGHIHIDYNDTTRKTTSLTVQVTQQNTTDTSAPEDVIASHTVANDANVTHTFDLSVYKGQSFFVRLEAEHPDFGTINRDYAVAFKGVRVPLGPLPDGLYIYVAGFGLMLLGGIFGATSATRGVVVIAFAGWLFYAFGWLDDLGLIAPASLGLVSTIAVMGVIVTRYREEGYT
ncbi:MAG: carboxypeptidase regulatory-like domain-containing protein, partial [Bacilli bacterium]